MAAPLWRGLSRLRFGACVDLVHAVGATLLLGRLRSIAWLGFSTPRRGRPHYWPVAVMTRTKPTLDFDAQSHADSPLGFSVRFTVCIHRGYCARDHL